jgi:hypothetical protein
VYRVRALVQGVDGDTVDLDLDLGFSLVLRQRVRLHGTDTPEGAPPRKQKFGHMPADYCCEGRPTLTEELLNRGLAKRYLP